MEAVQEGIRCQSHHQNDENIEKLAKSNTQDPEPQKHERLEDDFEAEKIDYQPIMSYKAQPTKKKQNFKGSYIQVG